MHELGAEPAREPTHIGSPTTSYEVVASVLLANPTVERVELVVYQEGPNWRDLSISKPDHELLLRVKGLKQDAGQRIHTVLSSHEVSAEKLRAFASGLGPYELLGITSKVVLSGGQPGHIPMMDFMCPPSMENHEALRQLLKEFQPGGGWLLESGRSYHYYGFQVLPNNEWYSFLGKCLLMSGFVDDRYIGHQLVDGHCVLRLSAGKLKAKIPTVVAEL